MTLTWPDPSAWTPSGRVSPTVTVRLEDAPEIEIGSVSAPIEPGKVVGVALDGHDLGLDDHRIDLGAGRRRPRDHGVDGQRACPSIGDTTAHVGPASRSGSRPTGDSSSPAAFTAHRA